MHETSNVSSEGRVLAPRTVPREIQILDESVPPPPVDISGIGVAGSTGTSRALTGVVGSSGNIVPLLPPVPTPSTRPPIVSRMMEGNLVHRVQPQYPILARQAGVQGIVLLRAVITRDGKIENLQVMSGHPLLVRSAMEAVLQWRYRPYYLNNEPVEVETQVTVNFTLGGR